MSGAFSPEESSNLWTQMWWVIRLSQPPSVRHGLVLSQGPPKPAGKDLGVGAHHAGGRARGKRPGGGAGLTWDRQDFPSRWLL